MHFRGGGVGHCTGFRATAANTFSERMFDLLGYDARGIAGGRLGVPSEVFNDADDDDDEEANSPGRNPDSDNESLGGEVDPDCDLESDADDVESEDLDSDDESSVDGSVGDDGEW